MPQGQMYVNVYIPDWNSLNDYQKSFMNFFVKDAAFWFYWVLFVGLLNLHDLNEYL